MAMRDLIEARSKTVAEMRKITEHPEGDGGDLSDDQERRFDQHKDELAALDKRIERQVILDAADRSANGVTLTEGGDDRFGAELRQYSLQKAIIAQLDPRAANAGREIEIGQELARRSGRSPQGMFVPLNALVEQRVLTVAGDGSNLVQTDVLGGEFIDALRPMSVAGALGARMLTGLRGDISIPKMDALSPAAAWLATEDSALSSGDHSFTAVTGAPKHVGAITTWSRKVLLQANPAIEQLVRADFQAKLAAAFDLAVLKGDGQSGVPSGIADQSDVNVATGGLDNWAELVAAMALVEAADVPQTSLGWALNAHVKAKLMVTPKTLIMAGTSPDTVVATTGGYIMETGNMLGGSPARVTSQLAGDPAASPAEPGEAIYGSWGNALMLFWGDSGADLLINPYESTAYTKGQVLLRALLDANVVIRHGVAFTYVTNITVA